MVAESTPQSIRAFAGMRARFGGGAAHRGRGPAEARGGVRLPVPLRLDEGAASAVVGVERRFPHAEHRCEASVAAFEELCPLRSRACPDDFRELLLQCRPLRTIHGMRQVVGIGADAFEQFGVELGLDGSERNVQLIARLVHVVEVGAAVEEVGAPCLVAQAGADQSVGGGHQGSGAVDHRRVHHLSLPGAPRFDEGGDHPKGEVEGAPAEISHQIERRGRGPGRRGRSRRARR